MRVYAASKLTEARPVHNLVISNVPGPPFPLYGVGARMVAYYPMGPVMDGGGLNITVMSYLDSLDFGLVACRETVPGVWDIAYGLGTALDDLKKEAERRG